uniref:Mobile element protein n=1 Tax=Klebsiella pneumoniae TaxID=573 RepID=A0A7D5JZ58_KLEPN|nr:Mobile element protein [Klebsiella pneumoniae]QMV82269.1 Mobile element protein [Klebsiella pneumoniae]
MYDGGFEVLPWLQFPSVAPLVQLPKAPCVTVKVLPDISAISALTAVKHGSYSSLTPPLSPVHTRKLLIWP